MKRIGLIAISAAISIYGCVTPQTPHETLKFGLSASKQSYQGLEGFCLLNLTLTNTTIYPTGLQIKILVLDSNDNTVHESYVIFATTLPGKTNEQKETIRARCDRMRKLVVTTNGPFVEPNFFHL